MHAFEEDDRPDVSRSERYRRWLDCAMAVIAAAQAIAMLYQAMETVWDTWVLARDP